MKSVFITFLCLFLFVLNVSENDASEIGKKAPDFKLSQFGTVDKISLSGLLDSKTVVILSFFDTKCEPCKKEIPVLKNIADKYSEFVRVFLINLDEKPEQVLPAYLKEYKVMLPVLIDPLGYRAGSNYDVCKFGRAEIPQLFVVGKDGTIKLHLKGCHPDMEQVLSRELPKLKDEKVQSTQLVQKDILTIIYTNSINGYLKSCNCPENPFGGLVRRITAIKNLKEKYPDSVSVDSGDSFPPRDDRLLAGYVLKMMGMIKYDVVSIGDQELICGVDYLEKNLNKLPFYSANLQACNETMCYPLTKPYLIKEVNNVKIAILSIIDKDVFTLFPKEKISGIKIIDHREYLKNIIPELRKQADIVIVVSHSGDDEDREIAKEIPGIEVIIGGHSQTLHKVPLKINNTLIVQTGENGHRVGVLKLKIGSDKKIISYTNEFILLDREIPDDNTGGQLVIDYHKTLKKDTEKLIK